MNTPTQNLTILHDSKEWSTEIEGEIGEIKVDGRKLSDIHDLALKIDDMTRIIKGLAVVATILAIITVGIVAYIGTWLSDNKEQISSTMDTTEDRFSKRINLLQRSNNTYAKKLTELGWTWKEGKWQQIVNKD